MTRSAHACATTCARRCRPRATAASAMRRPRSPGRGARREAMASPLLAFAIKLPLALLVFLLVAYVGTVSKRVAGVLLTFPILNGIAIIASDDPVKVADAIYPLVIFNCV